MHVVLADMVLRLSWSESLWYTFLLVLATAHWHGAEAQQVWTARTVSENADWMKVSYGNGMFVGVAEQARSESLPARTESPGLGEPYPSIGGTTLCMGTASGSRLLELL